MTETSPLWCGNDAPHGPHEARNGFGGVNTCTGRPEPVEEAVKALAEMTYVVPGHDHIPDATRALGIHAARAVLTRLREIADAEQKMLSGDPHPDLYDRAHADGMQSMIEQLTTKKIPNEETPMAANAFTRTPDALTESIRQHSPAFLDAVASDTDVVVMSIKGFNDPAEANYLWECLQYAHREGKPIMMTSKADEEPTA